MNISALHQRVAHELEHDGFHLLEIQVKKQRMKSVVEIFADSESGITSEQLAFLSRKVDPLVEAELLEIGPYELVVSSPGLDRPLVEGWQFRRHRGRQITVEIFRDDERSSLTGVILEASDSELVLQQRNGIETRIPLASIEKAKLVVSL